MVCLDYPSLCAFLSAKTVVGGPAVDNGCHTGIMARIQWATWPYLLLSPWYHQLPGKDL